MTRDELAWRVLSELVSRPWYRLRIRDDAEWLARHPGGFAIMAPVSEGEILDVNPHRIATIGRHLDHDEFIEFCEIINLWQISTVIDRMLKLPLDLVVAKWEQDHASNAEFLRNVAERNNMTLEHLLGADTDTDKEQ